MADNIQDELMGRASSTLPKYGVDPTKTTSPYPGAPGQGTGDNMTGGPWAVNPTPYTTGTPPPSTAGSPSLNMGGTPPSTTGSPSLNNTPTPAAPAPTQSSSVAAGAPPQSPSAPLSAAQTMGARMASSSAAEKSGMPASQGLLSGSDQNVVSQNIQTLMGRGLPEVVATQMAMQMAQQQGGGAGTGIASMRMGGGY